MRNRSLKISCLVVHKVLTASNFNCEIACLSFINVNQRWDIRAREAVSSKFSKRIRSNRDIASLKTLSH